MHAKARKGVGVVAAAVQGGDPLGEADGHADGALHAKVVAAVQAVGGDAPVAIHVTGPHVAPLEADGVEDEADHVQRHLLLQLPRRSDDGDDGDGDDDDDPAELGALLGPPRP